jgi:hypothetical protein
MNSVTAKGFGKRQPDPSPRPRTVDEKLDESAGSRRSAYEAHLGPIVNSGGLAYQGVPTGIVGAERTLGDRSIRYRCPRCERDMISPMPTHI